MLTSLRSDTFAVQKAPFSEDQLHNEIISKTGQNFHTSSRKLV